ncbi:MAG: rhodanese-like domain-containing protein [Actinomycetes bacterium]
MERVSVIELPTDQPVPVIGQSGGRSAQAAMFLSTRGFRAVNVAAGTSAWVGSGTPIVSSMVEV